MLYLRIICLFGIFLATGCASTIGNVSDIKDAEFQVGTTEKAEIAELLGFPEHRVVENEVEYWGYRAKPALSGVIYAFPTGADTVSTYTVTEIHDVPIGFAASAVIYAFDNHGVLVDVKEASK